MVSIITWYIVDGHKGMIGMSLEEQGAYRGVLDLIALKNNQLADDDRFIATWLGCDVRQWRRLKGQLMRRGRLYLKGNEIHDEKADVVVAKAVASALSRGRASALGGIANAANHGRNPQTSMTYGEPNGSRPARAGRLPLLKKESITSYSVTKSERALKPSPELVAAEARKNGNGSHPPGASAAPDGFVYVRRSDPRFENIASAYRVVYGREPKSDANGALFPDDVIVEPNSPTA